MISVFIFTSNDFRHWKIEERERERARRSHRSKTIALLQSFKPTLVEPSHRSSRSSRHFQTMREERDRESREIVAPPTRSSRHHSRTRSHQIANEPTRTALIALASHTANPQTRDRSTTNHESHHEPANPLPIRSRSRLKFLLIKFVCVFVFFLSLFDL